MFRTERSASITCFNKVAETPAKKVIVVALGAIIALGGVFLFLSTVHSFTSLHVIPHHITSIGCYVGGGAAVITGFILLFFGLKPNQPKSPRVTQTAPFQPLPPSVQIPSQPETPQKPNPLLNDLLISDLVTSGVIDFPKTSNGFQFSVTEPTQEQKDDFDNLPDYFTKEESPKEEESNPLVPYEAPHTEKFRYKNILPFVANLYCFKNEEDKKNIPFINANILASGDIVTQGPLPTTFEDFWTMVWDSEVPVIFMTTLLVENGKHKCDCYWPTEKEPLLKYPKTNITVTLKSEEELKFESNHSWTKAVLEIERNGEKRVITQYRTNSWYDNLGYPPEILLEMIRKDTSGPILAHCSAGVGRSMTFLAARLMDTIYKKAKEQKIALNINIHSLIVYLRTSGVGRPKTINAKEQIDTLCNFGKLLQENSKQ